MTLDLDPKKTRMCLIVLVTVIPMLLIVSGAYMIFVGTRDPAASMLTVGGIIVIIVSFAFMFFATDRLRRSRESESVDIL